MKKKQQANTQIAQLVPTFRDLFFSTLISNAKTRIIVFLSKNLKPIFKHLDYLDEIEMNHYFQFTLNAYVTDVTQKYI